MGFEPQTWNCGIRTPHLEMWDSNPKPGNVEFEMELEMWDSNPKPGNMGFELELPQYAELQHTLDTKSNRVVEEKRESAL